VVADALDLARDWCAGHIIDSAPALGHAVKVALVLGQHVPNAVPEMVAAALLHNCPEYAPKYIDLDGTLTARFGTRVTHVVRGLEREHIALDQRPVPDMTTTQDQWTLYVSAADKIVSLRCVLRRAARAPNPAAYWHARRAFIARVPYFAGFHTSAAPHLPPSMAGELAWVVVRTEQATARFRVGEDGQGERERSPGRPGVRDGLMHMTRRHMKEEPVGQYRTGQKIKVEATSIQRSNGAAWRGDEGQIIGETGDGYKVRFKSGFVAETVKDYEIKEA